MNEYSLVANNITANSADVTLTHTAGNAPVATPTVIISANGAEVSRQELNDLDSIGDSDIASFSGLMSNTTYTVSLESGDGSASDITFTTLADTTPKTATQTQWEDLAARIKAKADSSSIPTVNNSTITVTNNGTSKGTFTTNQASAGSVALDYPVITMTTTDPGEGSALAENNYIGVYGGDPIIMDYSTNEVNTGAKWIDGSAIYKKTVNFGAVPDNSRKSVAHNISNFGSLIKAETMANNGTTWRPLPFTDNAFIIVEITSSQINIESNWAASSYSAYITLYYTKSS